MLTERRASEIAWKPISKPALWAWTSFYLLFLAYVATNDDGFLFVDHVNLIVHEAGHLLFGWFGPTLGLWGGTLLELLVPAALAAHFALRGELTGVIFSGFFFFENFLYISVYMADARAQALPLVTVGDPELGSHDWLAIFSSLGMLHHDLQIARLVRACGWLGMIGSVVLLWLLWAPAAKSTDISGIKPD